MCRGYCHFVGFSSLSEIELSLGLFVFINAEKRCSLTLVVKKGLDIDVCSFGHSLKGNITSNVFIQ